jgi:hypothetical protein
MGDIFRRLPSNGKLNDHISKLDIDKKQAWGGGLISHFLLGLPPPMLYSFHPAINYLSIHLLVTLIYQIFPDVSASA